MNLRREMPHNRARRRVDAAIGIRHSLGYLALVNNRVGLPTTNEGRCGRTRYMACKCAVGNWMVVRYLPLGL